MTERILKFFKKKSIAIGDIKYITREDGQTCIYLTDGRIVRTYITAKDILEILLPYDYICISKGTIVSKSQIDYIDHCTYHMLDGKVLEGRKRTAAAHKKLNNQIHAQLVAIDASLSDIRRRFSVLDNMPAAFCVVELILGEGHTGVDFVFRYCNKEMEVVEGKKIEEMLDRSFYEVFPNADRKWLAAYSDVAVNGVTRYIRDYSPEINKELFVRCFSPMEGFCACLLIPVDDASRSTPVLPTTY